MNRRSFFGFMAVAPVAAVIPIEPKLMHIRIAMAEGGKLVPHISYVGERGPEAVLPKMAEYMAKLDISSREFSDRIKSV